MWIELKKLQAQLDDKRADTQVSQNLLGMMLPSHVIEDLENGRTPMPSAFNAVTVFFTGGHFWTLISQEFFL